MISLHILFVSASHFKILIRDRITVLTRFSFIRFDLFIYFVFFSTRTPIHAICIVFKRSLGLSGINSATSGPAAHLFMYQLSQSKVQSYFMYPDVVKF